MIETMTYDAEQMKALVLEETEKSLSGLKNDVMNSSSSEQHADDLVKAKLADFGKFVEKQKLNEIDRSTTLGRFLRIVRYGDHVRESSKKYNVPFDYLFSLIMVESQGNTASINETDGGAGFIHFQPDVAKEYGMKVFTDNKKYAQFDYQVMKKQGKTQKEIYKKHGEILKGLMNKSMSELEKLDDRFHTSKCIDATAKYLNKIKTHYVDKQMTEKCAAKSWDVYKNDTEFDFAWMLTLNGFNKGPANFTVGFADGSHVKNLKNNFRDMEKYKDYVVHNMVQGVSYEKIFEGLQKTTF